MSLLARVERAETGMLVLELSCGHTEVITELELDWIDLTAPGLEFQCSEMCDHSVVLERAWRQHGKRD